MTLNSLMCCAEAVMHWQNCCIEKVWEEIAGEEAPKLDDGELITKEDPDGTKHFIFMYKGSTRATAELCHSPIEPWKLQFSYDVNFISAASIIMMAARPQPFSGDLRLNMEIEEARVKLAAVAGKELAEKLSFIIDGQPEEKRLAFYETTIDAICGGANYSDCETIKDMSNVYATHLIVKYL
jgi:hypothetical protein